MEKTKLVFALFQGRRQREERKTGLKQSFFLYFTVERQKSGSTLGRQKETNAFLMLRGGGADDKKRRRKLRFVSYYEENVETGR